MTPIRLIVAALFLAVPLCPVSAQDAAETPSVPTAATLTEEQKARAVEFMCSPDATRRQGAYAAGRKLGEEGKEVYLEILKKAEVFHKGALGVAVVEAEESGKKFDEAMGELEKVREETMQFLRTDHEKNAAKIAELDNRFSGVESALEDVESTLKRGGGFSVLGTSVGILAEIWVEQAWCKGKEITLRDAAMQNERDAVSPELLKRVMAMQEAAEEGDGLEAAIAYNGGLSWASASQKAFAKILNQGRYVMGLGPLRLDERLSEAAAGHSGEMKKLDYFAHDSPVEKNKTPSMRASNAEFAGSFRGENIYWSSAGGTPQAAYRGWWESDGHRFIMFGDGPDTLGVGLSPGNTHWTMMTGKK